ncbi:MAG: HAD family phosphatase [Fretibacterium sp.]|nr:HAD family phosphatase [Fretibacterium sp.]
MEIKAILLDCDGTSLQKDQVYISLRNMWALRRAMDRGIQIIPCTGRVEDMQPPQIEAEPRIRYWVTSGGSRVVDRQTGEILYKHTWTPEQSAELCRVFEGQEIYSETAAEGKILMERSVAEHLERHAVPPHHVWFFEAGRHLVVDKLSDYFLKNKVGMEKENLYGVPKEKQAAIYQALDATGLVWLTDPPGSLIQFFPKDLDRSVAIAAVLKRLGIGFDQVMSLGDGEMDLPAIKSAGLGVAMGNASEKVKAQADYVTAPFDQDGVAQAIEKFVLSGE